MKKPPKPRVSAVLLAERGGFEPLKTLACSCLLLLALALKTLEFQHLTLQRVEIVGLQQIEKIWKKGAKEAHTKSPEDNSPGFSVPN